MLVLLVLMLVGCQESVSEKVCPPHPAELNMDFAYLLVQGHCLGDSRYDQRNVEWCDTLMGNMTELYNYIN